VGLFGTFFFSLLVEATRSFRQLRVVHAFFTTSVRCIRAAFYREIIIKVNGSNLLEEKGGGAFHGQKHVGLWKAMCMNSDFDLVGIISNKFRL
jgi:phosphoglycerol transferase MdoB-like AlkP superfamily enzyme